MSDDDLIGALITRLLAKRPDLWEQFRVDPLGALEAAGLRVTDEERAALQRAETTPSWRPSHPAEEDPLAAALKADLAAARAARAVDFNPLAEPVEHTETTEVDAGLLDEQKRLQAQAEALRDTLAEERRRQAQERERALRQLKPKKHE